MLSFLRLDRLAGAWRGNDGGGEGDANGRPAEVRAAQPVNMYEPTVFETSCGAVVLLGWGLFFTIGLSVGSTTYRDMLARNEGGVLATLGALFMFFLSSTPTNVAVLCCLAAAMGELGRRTRIDGDANGVSLRHGDYVAAITRGFLGYLALMSGLMVIAGGISIVQNPTQEQYIRMAAIISLVGFLAGFNPGLLRKMLQILQSHLADSAPDAPQAQGNVRVTVEGDAGAIGPIQAGGAAVAAAPAGQEEGPAAEGAEHDHEHETDHEHEPETAAGAVVGAVVGAAVDPEGSVAATPGGNGAPSGANPDSHDGV